MFGKLREKMDKLKQERKQELDRVSFPWWISGNYLHPLLLLFCIVVGLFYLGWELVDYYTASDESDPYRYVESELSDTGKVYEADLTSGEYTVGVYLPEGNYTADMTDGTGVLHVGDNGNQIFLNQSFGRDEESGEVLQMNDIRLYNGAVLIFPGDGKLHVRTETGQTQKMQSETNPLTEQVVLDKAKYYTAGEDFPAGIYDIKAAGSTWMKYSLYMGELSDESEQNYLKNRIQFEPGGGKESYCNFVFAEGMQVSADNGPLTLIPSPVISSTDYDAYYRLE